MNEAAFVERREPDWKRLSQLCDRADASPANLLPEEFHEFLRLYRRVSADLATVRTWSGNDSLTSFLNDLVGRAYAILYRTPRKPFRAAISDAVLLSAATVRRCRWFLLASTLLFLGSAFFSSFLLQYFSDTRDVLIPPQMQEMFESWKAGQFPERTSSDAIMMTAYYSSNNPLVAILSGSIAAATFGVGTFLIIAQNGMLLGALGHEMAQVGLLGYLLSSVMPHGVPELSGIVIAGAAGFVMGWALIHPGRRSRGDALRDAGRDSVVLLATAVVLMLIAAPIEGFFSFNPEVPQPVKAAAALVQVALWAAFWIGYGRRRQEA
jgi:uncharacterized membrane protein SpoIIM required for sporulation